MQTPMRDLLAAAVAKAAASPELIAIAIEKAVQAGHVSTVQHGHAAALEVLNTYVPPAVVETPAAAVSMPPVEKPTK